MNPKLTPRQTKVIAVMDEMLSYAKQAGSDIRMIGLTRGQFLDFMTIARKKRKHPELYQQIDVTDDSYRGIVVYLAITNNKMVFNQQQLSL